MSACTSVHVPYAGMRDSSLVLLRVAPILGEAEDIELQRVTLICEFVVRHRLCV